MHKTIMAALAATSIIALGACNKQAHDKRGIGEHERLGSRGGG